MRLWNLIVFAAVLAILAAIMFTMRRPPMAMVNVAWDAPQTMPLGYRINIDDKQVMEIPPPPIDPACKCLRVEVPVPDGQHVISVRAYIDSQPTVLPVTVENGKVVPPKPAPEPPADAPVPPDPTIK